MKHDEIENKIGYVFEDKVLLERVFTHGSMNTNAAKNYQSLEFLGDSILDFVVAKRLMEIYPTANEGTLTKLRANIVSRQPLADVVETLDLAKYLAVGKGENKEEIVSQSKIKSDIFEAIIAGIYCDSKSMDEAEKFVLEKLGTVIASANSKSNAVDFKSELNELCAKQSKTVTYELLEKNGSPNNPSFRYAVFVDKKNCGEGVGGKKRDAEQNAAEVALKKLGSK